MFDVKRLTQFAREAIQEFAESHGDETFYTFAIDDELLCLDSEEHLQRKWAHYRDQASEFTRHLYESNSFALILRNAPRCWAYRGFADLNWIHGFDERALMLHQRMCEEEKLGSDYTQAMEEVLEALVASDAFAPLRRTPDFKTFVYCRVDER